MAALNTITAPRGNHKEFGYSVLHRDSYVWALRRSTPLEILQEVLAQSEDDSVITTTRLLQVECPHPTCKVARLKWCIKPNGEPMGGLHTARWRHSFAQGIWEDNVELTLPDEEGLWP